VAQRYPEHAVLRKGKARCRAKGIRGIMEQTDPSLEQAHCKEERTTRKPIAAVIRREGSMPELGERRNAAALFRPTLAAIVIPGA